MTRVYVFAVIIFLIALAVGCQQNNSPELHPLYDAAQSFTLYPIVIDQMAILPMTIKGVDGLVGIDIFRNDTLWTYTDKRCSDLYYNLQPAVTHEAAYIPFTNGFLRVDRSSYKLDYFSLEKEGFIQSHLIVDIDRIIGAQALNNRQRYEIFSFDVKTEEFSTLQVFETDLGRRLLMRPPQIFQNPHSKETSFAASLVDFMPHDTTYSYFLFWKEDGKVDSIQATPPNTQGVGVTRAPVIIDSLALWLVDGAWIAVDLNKQKEVWRNSLSSSMITSIPHFGHHSLYSAMEDMRLYSINPHTGNTLWTQKIAGTPSRIFSRDSTLHLIGGSNGKYYRLHQNTGEYLLTPKTDAFFERTFYVDEKVAIVRIDDQWWIGTSIEEIVINWNSKSKNVR